MKQNVKLAVNITIMIYIIISNMSIRRRPPSNCGRQAHSKRSDCYDGKCVSSRAERRYNFRSASSYFHGRHKFSSNNNTCWKSTKDCSSFSNFLSKIACDYHRESSLGKYNSYKCYNKKAIFF